MAATPQALVVSLAALCGMFHKTGPKFPVEGCTTIGVRLPAMRMQETQQTTFTPCYTCLQ